MGAAHDQHGGAHDHEGQQRADVHEVGEDPERQERSQSPTTTPVRIVDFQGVRKRWWTAPKNGRQQAIAGHRQQDARLAQHQHQQHGSDARHRTQEIKNAPRAARRG